MTISIHPSRQIAQQDSSSAGLEQANSRLQDPSDTTIGEEEPIIISRITITALLAAFDLARHRHNITLDVTPAGTEMP